MDTSDDVDAQSLVGSNGAESDQESDSGSEVVFLSVQEAPRRKADRRVQTARYDPAAEAERPQWAKRARKN